MLIWRSRWIRSSGAIECLRLWRFPATRILLSCCVAWRRRTGPPRYGWSLIPELAGLASVHGGMVAATTTSLPARSGTGRDYDYRFSWIRDQCSAGQAVAADGAHLLLDTAVDFVADQLLARRASSWPSDQHCWLAAEGAAEWAGDVGASELSRAIWLQVGLLDFKSQASTRAVRS